MNNFSQWLFFFAYTAGLMLFGACDKENMNSLVIEDENIGVDTVYCNLELTITSVDSMGAVFLAANVEEGAFPVTYQWSDGSTDDHVFATAIGLYSLTITDDLGCIVDTSIQIDILPCNTSVDVQIISQDSSGMFNLFTIVSGGVPPYSHQWSEGSTSSDILVSPPGIFSVTVTDSIGCTGEDEIQL